MVIRLKVIKVLPQQSGVSRATGKPWLKQDFIGETEEQYPRKVCIGVFNPSDNTVVPQVGERVDVEFYIDSHPYVDRNGVERFNVEVRATKIIHLGDSIF